MLFSKELYFIETPLRGDIQDVVPTGSAFICDPPVLDTDRDFCLQVQSLNAFGAKLEGLGWDVSYDDPEYRREQRGEIDFITARKGIYNLIIFSAELGFWAFKEATDVAKALNLTRKSDRVMLFNAVCGRRDFESIDVFF